METSNTVLAFESADEIIRCHNSDLIALMVVLHRTYFSVLMTLGIRNQLTILVILYSSLFQQVHLLAELTRFLFL